MADPPFNIDKIPGLNIDTDTIKTSASNLKTKAGNMRTAASTMKTTWSGMSACYKAPEQETLYAAMDPVDTGFDTLADNVERVGEYLETFATTVEGIKKDAQTLKTDAETFLASIKDDSEWTYDQNKVDTQNGLVSRAGALQVRLWDAERTCANNIRALDCLVAYHADPTSENDPLGYGYSEIPAGATGEWGGPVERDDHCPKRAAVSVKRAVWDDFVLGTVNGLTNFAGIEIGGPNGIVSASWETFTSTWQGVGGFFGLTWDEYGNFQGPRWSTVGNTIKETLKGLVHYDEWSTDPLRAVTATILDVVSFAIPFAGAASKVGKFGKAGSVTARVGRVLEIVDKILQFTDPLGILTDIPMSKLTDTVVNALNITFDPTDLVAKWTGADAPAVDAPGVGGSTRGVDGASEVNVPEFDMEAGVPELDIPEVGAPELESLDVNVPEAAGTSSYDKTSSVEAENTVDLGVADRMSPTQPAEMAQPEMAMATSSQRVGELSSTGSVDGPGRVPEAHGSTGDAGIASADTAPTRAEAHASAGQTTPSSRAASGGSGAGETPSTHAAAGSGDTPARVTSGVMARPAPLAVVTLLATRTTAAMAEVLRTTLPAGPAIPRGLVPTPRMAPGRATGPRPAPARTLRMADMVGLVRRLMEPTPRGPIPMRTFLAMAVVVIVAPRRRTVPRTVTIGPAPMPTPPTLRTARLPTATGTRLIRPSPPPVTRMATMTQMPRTTTASRTPTRPPRTTAITGTRTDPMRPMAAAMVRTRTAEILAREMIGSRLLLRIGRI